MENPLYDPELDALGVSPSSDKGTKGAGPKPSGPGPKGAAAEARSGRFAAWIGGLSLPDVIGVGLAAGASVSAVLMCLIRPDVYALPALMGGLVAVAVLWWGGRHARRLDFRSLRIRLGIVGVGKAATRPLRRASGLAAGVFVGMLAGLFAGLAEMSSTADPPPAPAALAAPIAAGPLPAPSAAAVVGAPAIPPPRPPVAVPPLIEEPPTPPVAISQEELERLRAHYRSMAVLPMGVIMEGVRRVAGSDDWTRDGWRDYDLEFALDELVYRVRRATGRHRLWLPVRFAEVPAGIAETPEGALVVAKSKAIGPLRGSLVLADGDLEMPWASDSLILATGKVSIARGERNVVIAGEIDGGYENQARLGFGRFEEHLKAVRDVSPSLLISGTRLKMGYTFHAICSAPEEVVSLYSWDLTLLNSPVRRFEQATKCSESVSPRLDFRLAPPPAPEARGDPSKPKLAGPRRRAARG